MNRLVKLLFVSCMFSFASAGFGAATIAKCSKLKCVAKMDNGMLGESVKILNDKAQLVAVGIIKKRKGKLVLLKITDKYSKIKKNYPVIIKRQKNYGHMWKTMFSQY